MSSDAWIFKFYNCPYPRRVPSTTCSTWAELHAFCTEKLKGDFLITYQDKAETGPYIVECPKTFEVMKREHAEKELLIQGKDVYLLFPTYSK